MVSDPFAIKILDVDCPYCKADIGEYCRWPIKQPYVNYHMSRWVRLQMIKDKMQDSETFKNKIMSNLNGLLEK